MGPKVYEEPEDCNIYFAIVCTYKDNETWVLVQLRCSLSPFLPYPLIFPD